MATSGATIAGSISLGGADAFSANLKQVNKSIRDLDKELTELQKEMKQSGADYINLGQKAELLAQKMEQEKILLDTLKDKHKKSEQQRERNKKKVQELREALTALKNAETQNAEKIAEVTLALQKAENKVQTAINAVNRYSVEIRNTEANIQQLNAEIAENARQLELADTALNRAGLSARTFGENTIALGQKMIWVGQNFQSYVSRPIQDGFAAAIESGMSFEKSLSRLQATAMLDKTSSEMQALKQASQELGEQTVFTATQAADAFNYMALAGYNAQKSIETLPKVLALSIAGDMDLAQASDMVTDGLAALGLGTESATEFVDKMAKTASTTNTSVSQLGEAILTVGAAAANAKGGLTEIDSVLGILASSGIKASEAGTALRNIFTILSNSAGDIKDMFDVDVYDEVGEMRGLNEIFTDLHNNIEGWSAEDTDAKLNKIFGRRAIVSAKTLIRDLPQMYDSVAMGIANSTGAAEKMMDTMKDNFEGSVKELQSKLERLGNQVYEILLPILNDLADKAKAVIDWFQDLNPEMQQTIVGIGLFAAAIGPVIIALGSMVTVIGGIPYTFSAIVNGINALSTALGIASTTIAAATAAIGVFVIAAAAVKGVLDTWSSRIEQNTLKMLENSEELKNYISAAEETKNKIGETSKALQDSTAAFTENSSQISSNIGILKGYIPKLEELGNKTNRTAKEEDELKGIVQEINTLFPDMNLQIDENTGKLNMNTQAILDNANAYKYLAESKGAQALAEKAATTKAEATYNYNAAREEYNTLRKLQSQQLIRYKRATTEGTEDYDLDIAKDAQKQIAELNTKMVEQSAVMQQSQKLINDSVKVMADANRQQKEAQDNYNKTIASSQQALKNSTVKTNKTNMSYANAKDWVENRAYLKEFEKYGTTEGDSYGRLLKRAFEEYSQSEDDDWYKDYLKEVKALSQGLDGKDSEVYATIKKYLAEEAANGHINQADYKNIVDNMAVTQAKAEEARVANSKKANDEIKKSNASVAEQQKKETDKLNSELQKQYDKQIENSKKWIEYRNLYGDWDKYGTTEGDSYGRIAEKMAEEYKENAVEYSTYADKLNSLTASLTDKDSKTYELYWQHIEKLYNQGLLAHEDYVAQREQLSALGYKAEQKAAEEHLKEQKELYKQQQEDSKTWIGYRQLYGDWSDYNTTEGQSYGRVADKSGKAYKEGIIDYEEFTSEISTLTKSLTDKNLEVYSEFFSSLDSLYNKGLLQYDDYLRERNSLAAIRYQAEQKLREENVKQAEEIYKQDYKNVETTFDNQLKLLKSQMDDIKSSYDSQISSLKNEWAREDRAEELHDLYDEARKYRKSVTITGQKKYEEVQDKIEKLQREEQLAQLQEEQARIVEQLEAEYKDLETKKADTLARMEENQEQYQNNVSTVLTAMNMQLADLISTVSQAAKVQTITTNYITNDNSTNNNSPTYNNNINDKVDMDIFSRMINIDKLMN